MASSTRRNTTQGSGRSRSPCWAASNSASPKSGAASSASLRSEVGSLPYLTAANTTPSTSPQAGSSMAIPAATCWAMNLGSTCTPLLGRASSLPTIQVTCSMPGGRIPGIQTLTRLQGLGSSRKVEELQTTTTTTTTTATTTEAGSLDSHRRDHPATSRPLSAASTSRLARPSSSPRAS